MTFDLLKHLFAYFFCYVAARSRSRARLNLSLF